MSVTLKPELLKLIEGDIAAGRAEDIDDFLDKAIHSYLIGRDLEEAYPAGEIREKIERGLSQLDRGEGIAMEDAFDQLRARTAEFRKKLP